ncbi:MAG TPA: hypothetical protein VFS40_01340 [Gemmatimonadales bacterium]|nr:hypothetical protein [Gemmatimonadales bacterium]
MSNRSAGGAQQSRPPTDRRRKADRRRHPPEVLVHVPSDAVRNYLVRALEMLGAEAHPAATDEAASRALRERDGRIRLVICDPDQADRTRQLASHCAPDRYVHQRVLILSDYTLEELGGPAILPPRTLVLSKPFSPDALARILPRALGDRRRSAQRPAPTDAPVYH